MGRGGKERDTPPRKGKGREKVRCALRTKRPNRDSLGRCGSRGGCRWQMCPPAIVPRLSTRAGPSPGGPRARGLGRGRRVGRAR